MNKSLFWKVPAALFGFVAIMYLAELWMQTGEEVAIESMDTDINPHKTIAILGATGTAGDGLLKAAMDDPDVNLIHVITRRPSSRIDEGVSSGRVKMTMHMDYLDYSAVHDVLAEVDTVYWAIGLSAVGLDKETYGRIHVDFPMSFLAEWTSARGEGDMSFHYISGAGANADSRMMWAREKARAEAELSDFAKESSLRVMLYRPDYIAPTEEQAKFGQNFLYAVLAPINFAVRATVIGEAMLEVTVRGPRLDNGTILKNKDIIGYSKAYEQRRQ